MNESATRLGDVTSLVPGDTVEVRRFGDVLYRGHIEAVARYMGAVWVRDHVTGCRAMLHDDVFDVFLLRRCPLPAPTGPARAPLPAAA